ncbi:MAG: nickel pincer cofactor biosynthesis protein LarB [Deltaproteobacteria bacterium]|nr:nickel pincer cofactor biosynthesis protein LarB [Deltaproteobacteria bacterium]
MNPIKIREILERVQAGELSVEQSLESLKDLPFQDLGFARVDHHRALRQGHPEVILGQWKTTAQIVGIVESILARGQNILVTRVDEAKALQICTVIPQLVYDSSARTLTFHAQPLPIRGRAPLAIVTAGTADLPVADEAAVTARMLGLEVIRVTDVGVAGIHRLMDARSTLENVGVVIVVAGMEGALPSVIGGLISRPIIAVPTSVGYGAQFQGLAALLTMLNSCASGVTVVNIDNGFGAAFAASMILRRDDSLPHAPPVTV